MASQQSIVNLIIEQITEAGAVSARKMFGEYGVFCDGRMVALICDDQLFVKPTPGGRSYIGNVVEAPPYKGAKPYFVISAERWEGSDWLAKLIKITVAELPLPKKKPRKSSDNSFKVE